MHSKTAERLRHAVTAGAYWEVDKLLGVYRREVEESWKTSTAVERQELAATVTGLLQWARHSILASRAHTQHRLARLSRQGAYASTGLRAVEQLELDA